MVENASLDFAHFAYLDRSYRYLQLLHWHHVRQVSQIFFISNFLSKIEVFRTFLNFFKSDRSDNAYLDRSYQYLQVLYWHQVLENASWHSFRPFCLQIRPKSWFFALCAKSALPFFLILHIQMDLINIYNFCIDTKSWKMHLDMVSGQFSPFCLQIRPKSRFLAICSKMALRILLIFHI